MHLWRVLDGHQVIAAPGNPGIAALVVIVALSPDMESRLNIGAILAMAYYSRGRLQALRAVIGSPQ